MNLKCTSQTQKTGIPRGRPCLWIHAWVYVLLHIFVVPIKTLTHLHGISIPTSDPQDLTHMSNSKPTSTHTKKHFSSEKTHHQANNRWGKLSKWQSPGNPTTFKQIHILLCTQTPGQTHGNTPASCFSFTFIYRAASAGGNTAPLSYPQLCGAGSRVSGSSFNKITLSERKSDPFLMLLSWELPVMLKDTSTIMICRRAEVTLSPHREESWAILKQDILHCSY